MSADEESIPITSPEHQQEYYPYFDWLRIVLAAVVVLSHEHIIRWSEAGSVAVQVFFALSGWLIGGILLKTPRAGLTRFYFNRVARIWGPYYTALAIVLGVSLLRDPITPKWTEFVFYETTFVYNVYGPPQLAAHRDEMPLDGSSNHFWSVNGEEQFYLLAPLLLVVVSPIVGRALATWLAISLLTWYFIPSYASISFGVTAALAVSKFGPWHINRVSRIIAACVAIASGIAMAAGWDATILAPLFSIAVVLLLTKLGKPTWLGAVAGGISYPLYLNHWIGPFVAHAALKPIGLRNSLWANLVSVVFSVCFAYCMFQLVDRPLLRRRSAYYTPSRGRAAMLLAYALVVVGLGVGFLLTRE